MVRTARPFAWAAAVWIVVAVMTFIALWVVLTPLGYLDWLGIPGSLGLAAMAATSTTPVLLAFGIAAAWEARRPVG